MADKKNKSDFDDLSPEEKLFRAVISEDAEDENRDEDPGTEEKNPGWLATWGKHTESIHEFFLDLGRKLFPGQAAAGSWGRKTAADPWSTKVTGVVRLRNVNRLMVALVVLLAAYLVLDMVLGWHRVTTVAESGAVGVGQEISILPEFKEHDVRPVDYYLSKRNAFVQNVKPVPVTPAAGGDGAGEAASEAQAAPAAFKLVGISWDDQEFVAMIETDTESAAQFVKKGDELAGGITVKEVAESKVVLSDGAKEWELV